MNRELKFRIWDKLAEKYIYPDKGYQGHFILDLNGRFYNLQNGSGGDEYIVQQYTGLKDKNGILIFEGDLVQYNQNSNYDGINFEVTWSDVSFGWVLKSKNRDFLTNMTTPNGPRYNFLEVVGSIFETKKDDNNE